MWSHTSPFILDCFDGFSENGTGTEKVAILAFPENI